MRRLRVILDDGTVECLPEWAREQWAAMHQALRQEAFRADMLQRQIDGYSEAMQHAERGLSEGEREAMSKRFGADEPGL